MKVTYGRAFARDLRRVKDKALLAQVRQVLVAIERAGSLDELHHVRRIQSGRRHFRIRVGDYRIGLTLEGNVAQLVRFLPRKDIYRHFPLG